MRAHQIMTQQVITVGADTTIVEAVDTMLRHHISGLPVVDAAGKLIGIISEGDFIRRAEIGTQRKRGRWLTYLIGTGRIAADFVHAHGRKVGEIMTPDPLTITEDTPLDQIVQIMESNSVKRLPVMRGEPPGRNCNSFGFSWPRSPTLPAMFRACPQMTNIFAARCRPQSKQAAWRPCKLKVTVLDGIVSLSGVVNSDNARRAAIVAAENVPGVKKVLDKLCDARSYPPPEEDLGGGDFVSLQEQPSTIDDEPL